MTTHPQAPASPQPEAEAQKARAIRMAADALSHAYVRAVEAEDRMMYRSAGLLLDMLFPATPSAGAPLPEQRQEAAQVEASEPKINVTGDWRPIRDALEAAYKQLGRTRGSDGYLQGDWNLAVLMYEAAAMKRDTTPCIHCSKRVAWLDAFRCLDCRGVLCERCAPEHFGPKHSDRAAAAHPAHDNLMDEVGRVMREAIDAHRKQDTTGPESD